MIHFTPSDSQLFIILLFLFLSLGNNIPHLHDCRCIQETHSFILDRQFLKFWLFSLSIASCNNSFIISTCAFLILGTWSNGIATHTIAFMTDLFSSFLTCLDLIDYAFVNPGLTLVSSKIYVICFLFLVLMFTFRLPFCCLQIFSIFYRDDIIIVCPFLIN